MVPFALVHIEPTVQWTLVSTSGTVWATAGPATDWARSWAQLYAMQFHSLVKSVCYEFICFSRCCKLGFELALINRKRREHSNGGRWVEFRLSQGEIRDCLFGLLVAV